MTSTQKLTSAHPLEISELNVRFGGIHAVRDVSLELREGEILGLLGQNGAGKTTVVNCVSRSVLPSSGRVSVFGTDIDGLRPHQVARSGVSRTFQSSAVFGALTAMQLGLLARDAVSGSRATSLEYALRLPRSRRYERQGRARVLESLAFVGFAAAVDTPIGQLTYGQAKLADLGRALAADPKVLLLDEPASGLSLSERNTMAEAIERARTELHVPILIIEHDMELMASLCDRTIVMESGAVLAEGRLSELLKREDVSRSLLGVSVA